MFCSWRQMFFCKNQKDNVEYYVLKKKLKTGEITNICEKTEYGYPDVLRCKFIINHKNNFIRCKNKIFETSECCLKHYKKNNFYYEKYLQICKELNHIDDNNKG